MSYETLDRNRRTRTKHRGITFTERSDGGRTYFVTCGTRHVRVDGGLNEALAVQADYRLKRARGERVTPTRVTFGEIAEAWLASKRVEDSTRDRYRASLNVWLLPRWRDSPIASVTEDDLALMVRDAEAAGRAAWTIKNNLVVASGVFGFAVRRGHIARNPVAHLTRDERPAATGQERTKAFTRASSCRRCSQAADEHLLLYRLLAGTGLRIGEALGLEWRHIDAKRGVVRVEQQATPDGRVKRPKTATAIRDVPRRRCPRRGSAPPPARVPLLAGHRPGVRVIDRQRPPCPQPARAIVPAAAETTGVGEAGLRVPLVPPLVCVGADRVRSGRHERVEVRRSRVADDHARPVREGVQRPRTRRQPGA